ncbi:MAG: DUF4139 domain-containing protein [Bacteroidetes bacterium]|nr:DUF4139 domain-containing protein [Bacteroidota bacterium]
MKRIILYFVLFSASVVQAQSSKAVIAKLQKATVYLQGAHLYYNEPINLVAGNNEFVFENISPFISEASLQASSKGAVVMEVKHLLRYKEKLVVTKQYDKEIQFVLDSLEDLEFSLKDVGNKENVLATEKHMLLNNRIIKGEPLRDSLALLRDGMQFLQEKLNFIYEEELKLARAKNKITKQKNKLEIRYSNLLLLQSGQDDSNNNTAQPIHEVVVTLFSETAMNTQVSFNYFVQYANWVPQYDLQATSATSNFQLKYLATITQNTGINWANVPLTLSTSNPGESNTKPELNPWYLSFIAYRKQMEDLSMNARMPMQAQTASKANNESTDDVEGAYKSLVQYVNVTESMIRTEYEIKLNYTIASDGKAHKVLINQRDIPMLLQFAAVPKICNDAFLLARVTGWEDMNIIPGNARIYFDGAFVGEMYLNASTTSDTLSVNLGRDKSIVITRKKIKDNYKEKIIDDEKIETRSIELVVRNTKNIPIEIILEDQVPLVQGTNDIKVKVLKMDGATLEEATGKLTWNVKLGVKDSKKITFTYEIRHPKSKPIAGL